jgi:hypothetical protein
MAPRKIFAVAAVVALSAVTLAACGGGSDDSDGPSDSGSVAMEFWHNATTGPGKAFFSVPGLITVGILAFIASWNSDLLPLFILNNQNTFTLPLGVQSFASQYSVDTAKVLAFASLSMIPALVFFSLFERRIVEGGLPVRSKGELRDCDQGGTHESSRPTWYRRRGDHEVEE